MYLTTPEQGGETVFPDGDAGNSSSNSSSSSSTGAGGALTSSCAARGLVHRPVRGDALMFYRCGAVLLTMLGCGCIRCCWLCIAGAFKLAALLNWLRFLLCGERKSARRGGSHCRCLCLPSLCLCVAHVCAHAASRQMARRTRTACMAAAQRSRATSGLVRMPAFIFMHSCSYVVFVCTVLPGPGPGRVAGPASHPLVFPALAA
jgi:hypothetical protein